MPTAKPTGIDRITVRDFKSLAGEHSIEIRPLTILAGANSSGKSSIMQPLLLMKQTLEASYDPGALLLDGPILKFTNSEQFLTVRPSGHTVKSFAAGLLINESKYAESTFSKKGKDRVLTVDRTVYRDKSMAFTFSASLGDAEKAGILQQIIGKNGPKQEPHDVSSKRDRFYWDATYQFKINTESSRLFRSRVGGFFEFFELISSVVRVPGLRGNPLRSYPLTTSGKNPQGEPYGLQFPGSFEHYTASIIYGWLSDDEIGPIERLASDLQALRLASHVAAHMLEETRIELRVGRMTHAHNQNKKSDMVNIADVGFGVSQVLPVLVALEVAQPGQLVYLEQPEIHLHPRAQQAMASVLARAAMRGVRVVAETHSDLLILGIRTLVAEGKLPPELVKLHWFQRDAKGLTTITSADVDERGASSDWPEDFADVMLDAQARYLDAAELRTESR